MVSRETLCSMALSLMFPYRYGVLKQLYNRIGSAEDIVDNASDLQAVAPDFNLGSFTIDTNRLKECLSLAEQEAERAEERGIKCVSIDQPSYPTRLREVCPDSPLVLYFYGTANLNACHILSVVGTRNSTSYGHDITENICGELAQWFPDLLIVSGLAYGTDINAHRTALDNKLSTVGVLAHGLDRIYPAYHRTIAERMASLGGGLLTEFPFGTKIESYNFLRRNRIIAGLAEATLVIESKEKGGALATARIANEYSLAVMACPGRVHDEMSRGCNKLIRDNSAAMLTCAADVVELLGWQIDKQIKEQQSATLFDADMTGEERLIYDTLDSDGKDISYVIAHSGQPVNVVMSVLSELEFRGLVRQLPGAKWRRIM